MSDSPRPLSSPLAGYDGRMRKAEWEVRDAPLSDAQRLVRQFHYARGGSNTGTFVHGLYRVGGTECLGVAWWIPPTRSCAEASYPTDWKRVLNLSRLVIDPRVPKNACTFLLARSVRRIRDDGRFLFLLTYADQWQQHTGTIYKAANWRYVGVTKPEATFVDDAGRMVARKAGPKTRTRAEMAELGYRMVGRFSKHKFVMDLGRHACPIAP